MKSKGKMSNLYNEVKHYTQTHNNICDHLYNAILLEVFNEYSYKMEDDNNSNTLMTFEDLLHITDDIIDSDYFGEMLSTFITNALNKVNNE